MLSTAATSPSPLVFLILLRSFSAAAVRNHRALLQSNSKEQWAQLGNDIDGQVAEDWFGYSASMSGDGRTFVAGGPGNHSPTHDGNGNTKPNPDYVQVFEYSNESWIQLGNDIVFEGTGDRFGNSVAMSNDGRAITVGGPLNGGNGDGSGCVRVFEYSMHGGSWIQMGGDISGINADDGFGYSVAMSGDGTTIVAGGPWNHENGRDSGHVRVFEYSNGSWVQLGDAIDGEGTGDRFGSSVAISGDGITIIAGGPWNHRNGDGSGHARVFEYSGGSWIQLGDAINGEAAGDDFGYSVAMSEDGRTIVAGGPSPQFNGRDSGHARVFEYSTSGSWIQLGGVIDGEAAGDRFGVSVAMSGDGRTIVAGARQNGGKANGTGYARVFEYCNGAWNQLGGVIDGETTNDKFGISVAMSKDGRTIVAGTLENDNGSGQVRVYARRTDVAIEKSLGLILVGVVIVGAFYLCIAVGCFFWRRTRKRTSKMDQHDPMLLLPFVLKDE